VDQDTDRQKGDGNTMTSRKEAEEIANKFYQSTFMGVETLSSIIFEALQDRDKIIEEWKENTKKWMRLGHGREQQIIKLEAQIEELRQEMKWEKDWHFSNFGKKDKQIEDLENKLEKAVKRAEVLQEENQDLVNQAVHRVNVIAHVETTPLIADLQVKIKDQDKIIEELRKEVNKLGDNFPWSPTPDGKATLTPTENAVKQYKDLEGKLKDYEEALKAIAYTKTKAEKLIATVILNKYGVE